MAEVKTVKLDVETNLGSLKSQLKQAQAEVQTLADKFGATSRQAVEAAKKAAILKDRIGDAKSLTDAFNPDAKFKALSGSLQGVAGGFSVVTGALGAFGKQSEGVEQALLKVQSAMALASGAQALGESIDSFKQLGAVIKANAVFQKVLTAAQYVYNLAMSLNPIGAIVTATIALIAAGYSLIKMFQKSAEVNETSAKATKKNTEELKKQETANDRVSEALKTKNGHELNMAKASGASSEALRKLAVKHAEEEIALEKASLATARNTLEKEKNTLANYKNLGVSDEIIAKQRELVVEARKNVTEEVKDVKDAIKNKQEILRANQVEIKQEQTDARKQAAQAAKDAAKTSIDAAKEELDTIKDNQKSATDALKTESKRQIDDITAKYDEQIKLAKKYNKEFKSLEEARDKELKAITDSQVVDLFDGTEKLVAIRTTGLTKTFSLQQKEIKGLKGVAEFRQQVSEAEQALEDKKRQNLTDSLTATADTLGQISELFGKQTTAGKAAAIAEATIQTFLSAQKAYQSTVGIPVVGTVLAPINAGLAIAAGLKNIKAITAVQVPNGGGGGGGGGDIPNNFGAGTSQAPSFNVVGNSGVNQLAQLQQQPMQAYVVSGQVTTAQSLDRNRIENATL